MQDSIPKDWPCAFKELLQPLFLYGCALIPIQCNAQVYVLHVLACNFMLLHYRILLDGIHPVPILDLVCFENITLRFISQYQPTWCTKFYNKFISSLYMFREHVLIVRMAKLYYTVSGIITPIGGCPVHKQNKLQQPQYKTQAEWNSHNTIKYTQSK